MTPLRSRDNARVRRWSRLVREGAERRREGRAIAEGPHLVAAALQHEVALQALVVSESGLGRPEIVELLEAARMTPVVLAERLFRVTFDAEAPQGIAAEIGLPAGKAGMGEGTCVFLEGVQDPGNVGAIVRSAAAFGAAAVVLDSHCADPWSPKALRSGMGGHFALNIVQCASLEPALRAFEGKLLAALSRGGTPLHEMPLEGRIGWLFGSEGGGLSPATQALATAGVSIPLATTMESLNVAAAAAVCLYETARRRSG